MSLIAILIKSHIMRNTIHNTKKEKILTGDRATGQLHLGHFVGSLQQRVKLQHEHEQTILVADLQGLTDNGHNPHKVSSNILNVVADYLAVGIDPSENNYLFTVDYSCAV